jgi:16S rRNA (cytosine1402-N4)-methyltransferase
MPKTKAAEQPPHLPVLYQESINILKPAGKGHFVDGTLGAGGHAAGILEAAAPDGQLIGMDVDTHALAIAEKRLERFGSRVKTLHLSYALIGEALKKFGWQCADGILLDLGLSSMQMDNAVRGFSFSKEAPLDMRFNPEQTTNAADLVNTLDEKDLADIIWKYGEEPRSRQIAAAIISVRPVTSTTQLARIIQAVFKGDRGKIHPATRTFQALRIAVNKELETLKTGLQGALHALCPGGRLAVISFHSLEDRLVKQYFQTESRDCICPPEQLVCICGHKASIRLVNRKVIVPSEEEVEVNPRARSAKLRAVEKL